MNEERNNERFVESWNAFTDKNGLPMIEEMANFSLIYGTYSKAELDEYIINPLFNPAHKCCPIRKDAEMSKTLEQIAKVW